MSNTRVYHGVRPAPFPVEARNQAQRQPIVVGAMTPSLTIQPSSSRQNSLSPPPPSEVDRILSPQPTPEPELGPLPIIPAEPSTSPSVQLTPSQRNRAAYRASDKGRAAKEREKIGRIARKAVKDAETKLSAALSVRSTRSRPNQKAISAAQAEYELATARLAEFQREKKGRRSVCQREAAAARSRDAGGSSGRVEGRVVGE